MYFTFTEHKEALVFNAESKPQGTSAPDPAKIEQALDMLEAYIDGNLSFAPHKGR